MLGVLGALVTLAVIGLLAFQALAVRVGDPLFRVELIAVEQTAQGFVREVRVRNDGGTTAEAVHLVGTAGRSRVRWVGDRRHQPRPAAQLPPRGARLPDAPRAGVSRSG